MPDVDTPRGGSASTSTRPAPWPNRLVVHALIFLVFLSLWTWKLLEPQPVPEQLKLQLDLAGLAFIAAKILHATAYAFLTTLVATLPAPWRWRAGLIGLLVLHAVGTEIGQLYVPNRHGRWEDVLIDWGGITGGLLVVRWWRKRKRSKGEPGT